MPSAGPSESVEVGLSEAVDVTVEGHLLTSFWGKSEIDVLATPSLVHLVELAASNLLEPRLPSGFTSVGLSVAVDHLAASASGVTVTAEARVTGVDGRRVDFDVAVREGEKRVARGTHARFIVDRERFMKRLGEAA